MSKFSFYCNVRFNLFRIENCYHEFANVSNGQKHKTWPAPFVTSAHQITAATALVCNSQSTKRKLACAKRRQWQNTLVLCTVETYLCFVIVSHSDGCIYDFILVKWKAIIGPNEQHFGWIDSMPNAYWKWWLSTELPWLIKISCEREHVNAESHLVIENFSRVKRIENLCHLPYSMLVGAKLCARDKATAKLLHTCHSRNAVEMESLCLLLNWIKCANIFNSLTKRMQHWWT